ncbi:alpha/beta fold hydrolase [Desulfurobacterium sp.]
MKERGGIMNIYTIHGWSFNKSVWNGTPFSDGFHFELPGHGDSNLHVTDLFDVARVFGEEIKNKGATVVGWSMGASVAALMAFLFPEKIERLILYSPTPLFCGISQPLVVCRRFLKRLKFDFQGTVGWFRKECGFYGEFPLPEKEKAVVLLENYMSLDLRRVLSELSVNANVYVGLKDEITKPEGAFAFFSLLPSCTLEVYPFKSHFLF